MHFRTPIGHKHVVDYLKYFSVVTSFGRPERSTSIVLMQPLRNSVNLFFTVHIDGAETP